MERIRSIAMSVLIEGADAALADRRGEVIDNRFGFNPTKERYQKKKNYEN